MTWATLGLTAMTLLMPTARQGERPKGYVMSLIVQLICEDRDLTVMMVSVLNSENFKVVVCDKPLPGLLVVQETLPDTVILEDRLSMVDSVDLCYHIGNLWRIPLILIGDEGTETSVSGALMRGADFFMLRPLSMRELVARVKALPRQREEPGPVDTQFSEPGRTERNHKQVSDNAHGHRISSSHLYDAERRQGYSFR